jgi:hypothetical protein
MYIREKAQNKKTDEYLQKRENNNIDVHNMWSVNELYRISRTAGETDKNKQKC